jgi:hypothetical protein
MTATAQPPDNVEARLRRLERENRRLKRAGVALLGLAALGALLGGQAQPKEKTVTAREFILEGSDGTKRAALYSTGSGAYLALYGKGGETVLALSGSDTPGLTVYDPGRKLRAVLTVDKDSSALLLGAGAGEARAALAASKAGSTIELKGADGKPAFVKP